MNKPNPYLTNFNPSPRESTRELLLQAWDVPTKPTQPQPKVKSFTVVGKGQLSPMMCLLSSVALIILLKAVMIGGRQLPKAYHQANPSTTTQVK